MWKYLVFSWLVLLKVERKTSPGNSFWALNKIWINLLKRDLYLTFIDLVIRQNIYVTFM